MLPPCAPQLETACAQVTSSPEIFQPTPEQASTIASLTKPAWRTLGKSRIERLKSEVPLQFFIPHPTIGTPRQTAVLMMATLNWVYAIKTSLKFRNGPPSPDCDLNPISGLVSKDVSPARKLERVLFWRLYDVLPTEYQRMLGGVGGDAEYRILWVVHRFIYRLLGRNEEMVV